MVEDETDTLISPNAGSSAEQLSPDVNLLAPSLSSPGFCQSVARLPGALPAVPDSPTLGVQWWDLGTKPSPETESHGSSLQELVDTIFRQSNSLQRQSLPTKTVCDQEAPHSSPFVQCAETGSSRFIGRRFMEGTPDQKSTSLKQTPLQSVPKQRSSQGSRTEVSKKDCQRSPHTFPVDKNYGPLMMDCDIKATGSDSRGSASWTGATMQAGNERMILDSSSVPHMDTLHSGTQRVNYEDMVRSCSIALVSCLLRSSLSADAMAHVILDSAIWARAYRLFENVLSSKADEIRNMNTHDSVTSQVQLAPLERTVCGQLESMARELRECGHVCNDGQLFGSSENPFECKIFGVEWHGLFWKSCGDVFNASEGSLKFDLAQKQAIHRRVLHIVRTTPTAHTLEAIQNKQSNTVEDLGVPSLENSKDLHAPVCSGPPMCSKTLDGWNVTWVDEVGKSNMKIFKSSVFGNPKAQSMAVALRVQLLVKMGYDLHTVMADSSNYS